MEKTLSRTQKNVFNFLKDFLKTKGYPPTLREIACHFGLKGPRAPQKTLAILERKGYVKRVPGGSRAIEILGTNTGSHRGLANEMGVGRTAAASTISIPLVGVVRAGEPLLAIENIEGHFNFDRSLVSSKDVFLLRVQGESMIDAHIQDGDFALVKPQSNAENGEIVVALIEDEATIKRIFKKRDLIRLEPANPNMEPIVVKKGEKNVAIIGKVIGIFRKI
jgi:repressor LexA